MNEERYFRIVGQNNDKEYIGKHHFETGTIGLLKACEAEAGPYELSSVNNKKERWWVETQALEEVFKPKSPKFVQLCDNVVGFKKLIPGYAYEVLFEDEGEWGYIYQVRELLTDNIINCKVSKSRFEVLKGYDMLASKETKEIIDIVSSSSSNKEEDKGKHYRYSFRLNLTEEDKKNGFVMVNIENVIGNTNVDSPSHYQLLAGFEVKDLMRIMLERIEESDVIDFTHFQSSCYKEAMQYLLRFMRKNGIEDIKKSIHYLEQVIEEEEWKS